MRRRVIGTLVVAGVLLTCVACAQGSGTDAPKPTQPSATDALDAATLEPAPSEPTPAPEDIPSPTPTPEPPLAARVNGHPIYLADYDLALAQYEADLRAQDVDPESDEGMQDLSYARTWILNVMIEQSGRISVDDALILLDA